jgi:sterol 3beta-glucosyltransferase
VRVTMLTLGSRGDVQPFVALGLGLEAAGYAVRLATHPRFEPLVAEHGLAFAPLAEGQVSRGTETAEGRRWIADHSRRMPAWVGFLRDARSVADRRLADAARACEAADVIVASNLAMVLGWQMADLRGVPLVRAFIAPPAWMLTAQSIRPAAPLVRQLAWLAARPWLNRVRRRAMAVGPLPLREPFAELDRRGMPALYAFSPAVLPAPPSVAAGVEVTGYWFLDRSLDPDPPEELVEFVAGGPPPVSIGFSTMIGSDAQTTAGIVVEALRRAGLRGVLIGAANALVRGSPDVLAVDAVSHEWLFPRCAAVVHHAAVGTTAAGIRAGVPAVAVPHMTDQFLWAKRLHELGVSPAPIPRRELTAQRLADALGLATRDDGIRSRAAALSAQVRAEDGLARAVRALQRRVPTPSIALQPRS